MDEKTRRHLKDVHDGHVDVLGFRLGMVLGSVLTLVLFSALAPAIWAWRPERSATLILVALFFACFVVTWALAILANHFWLKYGRKKI